LILAVLVGLAVSGGPVAPASVGNLDVSPNGPQSVRLADSAAPAGRAPLVLEDPLQPLSPDRPRTEADRDRLEALALFATGRMHERQQEYAQALRLYQRAFRSDPESLTVVRAVISLAVRMKRDAQAVRYVLKAVEIEEPDPQRLQRLGAYLFQAGNLRGAVKLYEKALASSSSRQSADEVRLRMLLGRLYHATGEHGKAADNFAHARHALDHPEKFGLDQEAQKRLLAEPGLIYNLFGECFLLAGRLDEAEAVFAKAHQLDPNEMLLNFNLARLHARRGEPRKALAALEDCLKQRPANEGMAPFQLLANLLDELGKQGELIGWLEQLRADDPKNVPLGYFLAEQYHEAGQCEKAEPLYRELINTAPTPTGYRRLVEIYRKTGRLDELLAILGEVVEKTGLLEALGDQTRAVTADADQMQSVIKRARAKYGSGSKDASYSLRFAVALLALEGKRFETAAEFFHLALQAEPEKADEVFFVWGVGLLLEERPAEAADVFQRGIDQRALPDDDPRLYYLLAGALSLDDQTDRALAAARKAVESKEDVPRFHSRVAWILFHARRYDEAITAYRGLIEKFDADHASSETRDALREARLVLSNLYVLKDDLAEAEEWLEQVFDEFPDDVGASNDLGYLWADQGKHLQRALKMIQHAVEAEPDNTAYRDSLGWVFYRLGRHQEAVAELEKAAALEDQPDPVILDHLGDARLKVNQPQKAKQAWRRAAKAFKKREEPQKAKEVRHKIKASESGNTNDE
jgi:tetratricopeptide (TPR) repeat protein